jgi:Fe-S-cluster-containing dehydrogenase component
MDSGRRRFLQIAGLSVLGLGAKPVLDAVAETGTQYTVSPKAKQAKRWGMVVDVKKAKDNPEAFKKSIEACHLSHNVPTKWKNPRHEVKWIWEASFEQAFPGQEHKALHDYLHEGLKDVHPVLLCNHCDNPPCVRVCPTKATFRRPDGIIVMDYHRCIGCRFCMAACPYGARSLNWVDPVVAIKELGDPNFKFPTNREFPERTRGVVEKCTFCSERLSVGQDPACVEASQGCLAFGDMEDPNSPVRKLLKSSFSMRRKAHLGTDPQVYYIL